ncbi:MAG: glycosyltransferase family 4 protein [Bdellovibrionales bacterium]
MNRAIDIPILLFVYLLALGFTFCARNMLLKRALLDYPNERSSHKTPVPRGGGWALLAVLVPGMIISGLAEGTLANYTGLIAGVSLLAFVCWLDDRKRGGVSAGLRLGAHIVAACFGSLAFSSDQTLFGSWLPFWLDRTIMIVGWAWFMNLYNFMDGIDGITSVETVSIAVGVCLVMLASNIANPFAVTLSTLLIGACLGFLAFNWHPAKIFLGDVGSVPLGYLTGFMLLVLATNGHLAPALVLPAYYLADSGLTLIRRGLKGEKIWKAHRSHYYQCAANRTGRHDRVVMWIALANLALIVAAIGAVTQPLTGLAAGIAVVAFLLKKMHKEGHSTG